MSLSHLALLLLVFVLFFHAFLSLRELRHWLHLLQLNSYFSTRYLHCLARHWHELFTWPDLEPCLAGLGMLLHKPHVTLIILFIAYLKRLITFPQCHDKKAFVVTARVKRLLCANFIILVGLYTVTLHALLYHPWLRLWGALFLLVTYHFYQPWLLVLLNLFLLPIEKLICCHYSRDAKDKLTKIETLKVIGITGSYGKTSTKYLVSALLDTQFRTLKTPQSYNTLMGVTKTIRDELKPYHEVFVVEMSAKQPGDIKELTNLVNPSYALITNIGVQHLETFHTLDTICRTKNELFSSLPANGTAFCNLDDPNIVALMDKLPPTVNRITYGINQIGANYTATNLTLSAAGCAFTIDGDAIPSPISLRTQLLGRHNISNLLGAIAIAHQFGVPLTKIVFTVRKLSSVPHRLNLLHPAPQITFIDDTFNANPIGSTNALEVLTSFAGKRKIVVTPGLIELGAEEENANFSLGVKIAQYCDYVILVGQKQTAAIQKGLAAEHYPEHQLKIVSNLEAAKKHLSTMLTSGDVVLFENDLPDDYAEN